MAPKERPSNLLKGLSRRTARCILIVTPLIIISPALLVLAGVEWRWIAWYAFCCYVSFFEMVLMSAGMPCTFSSLRFSPCGNWSMDWGTVFILVHHDLHEHGFSRSFALQTLRCGKKSERDGSLQALRGMLLQ